MKTIHKRNGFTLIEMLVVMSVFTFMLASVALAMGTLFRTQGDLQDNLAQATSDSRLATQLRADAHQAKTVKLVQEEGLTIVRLVLSDATIEYTTHPNRIVRTVEQNETRVHREVFSLREGTTVDWKLSDGPPTFVTLTTSYRSPELREDVARPHVRRVETSIGLYSGGVR
jgi:prepilin-type N-terminal cleavage/methylation domain-containing protein